MAGGKCPDTRFNRIVRSAEVVLSSVEQLVRPIVAKLSTSNFILDILVKGYQITPKKLLRLFSLAHGH